ncbi:hypothetical protein DFJ74DRAFT_765677 [Hyaloraphidium curvatum]|nr:hypothetical protein DFJ74DRAFT_765677 [Hyaloraphidium curvatum]
MDAAPSTPATMNAVQAGGLAEQAADEAAWAEELEGLLEVAHSSQAVLCTALQHALDDLADAREHAQAREAEIQALQAENARLRSNLENHRTAWVELNDAIDAGAKRARAAARGNDPPKPAVPPPIRGPGKPAVPEPAVRPDPGRIVGLVEAHGDDPRTLLLHLQRLRTQGGAGATPGERAGKRAGGDGGGSAAGTADGEEGVPDGAAGGGAAGDQPRKRAKKAAN